MRLELVSYYLHYFGFLVKGGNLQPRRWMRWWAWVSLVASVKKEENKKLIPSQLIFYLQVKELDKSCDIVTISYAISRHFHAVVHGSVEPLSMVVKSDGSYGVHEELFFSLPVRVVNGEMRVVPDIGMDSITRR